MSYLLDTNVISELGRKIPDQTGATWANALEAITISAITMDELVFGFTVKPSARVLRWFEEFVGTHCRVLAVTEAIARHAGILRGQLARRGKVRLQADMLIAATAAMHGLTLATRNESDFEGCGVIVMNPFAD